MEISDVELETNPEFMKITAASEVVILLAFEVNTANASGLVSLCYPFFTLESILPRLGQQSYVRQTRDNQDERERANHQRLAQTKVPLRAELCRGQMTLRQARQLKVGDVVSCNAHLDEPAVVFVDEEPKFVGRPCAGRNGHLKVRVAGVIPAELEEDYKNRCRPVGE